MDLRLRPELSAGYTSRSQRARVVTEDWAERELYCPACTANHLLRHPHNRAVSDFRCDRCEAEFQLKAKAGKFGPSVSNSAFAKKMEAIAAGRVPNYVFLSYTPNLTNVTGGFVVPGHFITASVVQRRRPLRDTARRRGWVGSNLLIGLLPRDARVWFAENSSPRSAENVRREWSRFQFLQDKSPKDRRWMSDVLAALGEIGKTRFRLADVYAYEPRLARLHPENRNVRPKIRQQLQQLRDRGLVRFLGQAEYEIVDGPT